MSPFLLVLSAPSGGGKTTIARALLAARDDLGWSISATTRPPRDGETDGEDYHFLSPEEFDRRVAEDAFLEWAQYGAHEYGTLRAAVDEHLAAGRHVVLDIDVQGARQVRERCDNVVSIFIIPPSAGALLERLGGRQTERRAELRQRLQRAVEELAEAATYDYIVVNEDRTQAVAEVAAIIDAETRRPARMDTLGATLDDLRQGIAAELERFRTEQDQDADLHT